MNNMRTNRLTPPIEAWPSIDQRAWAEACRPRDPFDDHPSSAAHLRPASLIKYCKGYARWLAFLASRGQLDPNQAPFERVSVPRLRAYLRHLIRYGNADYTIDGRFKELQSALEMLAPGEDVSWVCKPDGATIYSILEMRKRDVFVPDAQILYRWGMELMAKAINISPATPNAQAMFRDGLLICMLAARGRRLRAIHSLRVGKELIRTERGYRIELAPGLVKTNKADKFDLPASLTPHITYYLEVVRPALLADTTADALWISKNHQPLTQNGITSRIKRLSLRRFGISFGPHRFRHAIATTAALQMPEMPDMGAEVLGISSQVAQDHYNRGGPALAARLHDNVIESLRQEALNATRRK